VQGLRVQDALLRQHMTALAPAPELVIATPQA
jgi:hypothetical protein